MTEEITVEEAKQLVGDAEYGTLILGSVEDVPSIGTVPIEERKKKIEVDTYRFGEWAESEDS